MAHLADLQEKTGDSKAAAESFQRGLSPDTESGDPHREAIDWFDYGQFLRRHGLPDELAYPCLLHAENLLSSSGGPEFGTVQTMRRQVETRLGRKAAAAQKDVLELLARASSLPAASF